MTISTDKKCEHSSSCSNSYDVYVLHCQLNLCWEHMNEYLPILMQEEKESKKLFNEILEKYSFFKSLINENNLIQFKQKQQQIMLDSILAFIRQQ